MHRSSPCVAILFALSFANGVLAQDESESQAILELDLIRHEIARIRAQGLESAGWLDEQRADEVRAIVHDVLADASTRASLQESTATSGYKDGFFLASPDANWNLRFRGYIQTRFTYDNRPSVTGLTGEQSLDTWGFGIRRMIVILDGVMIDPSWKYKVQLVTVEGEAIVDDAYLEKKFESGFIFRVGQFVTPFIRENLVMDTVPMMVDRSSVAGFFWSGRTLGLQLEYERGDFRTRLAYVNDFIVKSNYFNSGDARNMPWPSEKVADYAFAARGEYKPAGTWAQFNDMNGWRTDEFGCMLGVACEVERKGNNQGVPAMYGDIEPFVLGVTADLSLDWSGVSVFTYGVWRQIDPNEAGLAPANQFGFLFMVGAFVSDTVQLVARYEYGEADSNPNGATPALNQINLNGYSLLQTIGVGANWYIHKQRVKISGDLCYAIDGIGAFADPGNGFLADGTSPSGAFDESGQLMARLQLQIAW